MEVSPGIFLLEVPIPNNSLGHLNAYLIEGKDGWLMIDTGWFTAESFSVLQTKLKEIGLSVTDVVTIIITHVHPDHFGLAGKIKQLSPRAELLMHSWESDMLESRYVKFSDLSDKISAMLHKHGVPSQDRNVLGSASMPALEYVTITFPDRILYGGEIISTGIFDLEIIWTPGHSPGHICLYEPQNKLLFSGDHILPHITPNISYHVQSGDNPLGDYLYSLHKLENLSVSQVLPAHEQIFIGLNERIKQITEHHDNRKTEILNVIGTKPHNAWEIASQLTWSVPGRTWEQFPPYQQRSAVMETISHMEYLRWGGKVQRIINNDGTISYQLIRT